jgi:proline dehydrogenase
MGRGFLIYLSKAAWAQRVFSRWGVARRAARRFVAGETIDDAMRAVREMNAAGIDVSLDHLGENTLTGEDASRASAEIVTLLDRIAQEHVRAYVSIKLSQIGLLIDPDLFLDNLRKILEPARRYGIFFRFDMEDSSLTERTLAAYRWARQENFEQVGVVIQAYLYRSAQDIENLAASGARVRLCKGAYLEPPDAAFPRKADVDQNYDRLAERLCEISLACGLPRASENGWAPPLPAFATHDLERIAKVRSTAARLNLPADRFEFQMLYGIRRDVQQTLIQEGYRVRVYIPYGTHWYPYFMRRLAERPANVWFFLSNLVKG